jgi:hypothetical protein
MSTRRLRRCEPAACRPDRSRHGGALERDRHSGGWQEKACGGPTHRRRIIGPFGSSRKPLERRANGSETFSRAAR